MHNRLVLIFWGLLKPKRLFAGNFLNNVGVIYFLGLLTAGFFVLFNPSTTNAAGPTYVNSLVPITEPTVWTKDNSPYFIADRAYLVVTSELTIEPGVVVKFDYRTAQGQGAGLMIAGGGRLSALGTTGEPITFTSIFDDTAAGDTNGDGSATTPQPGLWQGLWFLADTSEIANIEIRYAGNRGEAALQTSQGSALVASDVLIRDVYAGGVQLDEPANPIFTRFTIERSGGLALSSTLRTLPGLFSNSIVKNNNQALAIHPNNTLQLPNTSFVDNQTQVAFINGSEVTNNIVWPNLPDLTYLLSNTIDVLQGATLTIQPGVVIKASAMTYPATRLRIRGSLNMLGQEDKPITITSTADSSIGADLSLYGAFTSPAPGQWGGIRFESSSSNTLTHVNLRYGGQFYGNFNGIYYQTVDTTCLNLIDSEVVLSNFSLANCYYEGLRLDETSNISINNSYFVSMPRGINSNTLEPWTVSNSSFVDLTNFALQVDANRAQVDARNNWWGATSGPWHADNPDGQGVKIYGPVLFDPWVGKTPQKDPIILIPGILGSWEVKGKWYLDPILHTYDDLWVALQQAGYEVGETLFALPYNWRQNNVLTSIELKNKIDEVKQICDCSKVDLVAHSMGGLVARSYIQGSDYEDDVDQVIFLGTPQRGSSRAYLQWEALEGFDSNLQEVFAKAIIRIEALKSGYFYTIDYVREQIISLRQLLPIDDYLRNAATGDLRIYPTGHPRNTYLENLNVTQAVDTLRNRVDPIYIIGDLGGNSTLSSIRVIPDPNPIDNLWPHGKPENFGDSSTDQGLEYGFGDGTVTLPSASSLATGSNIDAFTLNSKHDDLPTNAQLDVIEQLTGTRPTTEVRLWQITKILMINIKSPADIQILDPEGKRVGKDFDTGNILTEVPGSFYTGYDTDVEFITIPNPLNGEYEIKLEGTGSGLYTVETSAIDDDKINATEFTGFIDVGVYEQLNLTYNIEENNLEPLAPDDNVAPVITIASPETGRVYTHQDIVTLEYSVTDNTGVQSSKATFSSQLREVTNGEAIDLFFEPIGSHTLTIEATDFLNNTSYATVTFAIGATYESTIADINRSYELGWIQKAAVHDSLIYLFQAIIKNNKQVDKLLGLVFLNHLEQEYNKGSFNISAYNLIKGDVEWLISNL